ncbi:MAG: CHC2 zinc finger domain-containing protein, partial [Candidatus Rifleibacteriota bacterium]
MGIISNEIIAEIRERTDIVQIIGEHVRLIPSGHNYKALCPLHKEKTPSFNVVTDKQIYHCFGCGKGGDVFSFL